LRTTLEPDRLPGAGRTYVAIDQVGVGTFTDATDLLIDITGVTGAIATSNFI
jgi:hypothetical protein